MPSAPYIIAAYALLWVALLVYVLMVFRGTKKATAQLTLLEEAVADQQGGGQDGGIDIGKNGIHDSLLSFVVEGFLFAIRAASAARGRIPSGDWSLLCSAI